MPVTIRSLTSNLNFSDGNSMMNEELIQYIVELVIARIKEEQYIEDQLRQEREFRDRMSDSESF